jgi:DnaD/phage-associated family protein
MKSEVVLGYLRGKRMEEQQHITDEGTFGKYFFFMLNMADDDLDVYEFRLLGHYRRKCGFYNKPCTESTATTAKKIGGMSQGKVSETRHALASKGWIVLMDAKNNAKHVILIDRMAENIARYSKPSPGETAQNQPSPHEGMIDKPSPGESSGDKPSPHEGKPSPGEAMNQQEQNQQEQNQPVPAESTMAGGAGEPTLPKVVVQVIDPNLARVSKHYEANIGMIAQRIAENLKAACDEYPAEWIIEAINEAVDHNARNWKYAHAILKRWNAEGKDDGRKNGQANATGGNGADNRTEKPAPFTESWEVRQARAKRMAAVPIDDAERLRRERELHSSGGEGGSGSLPGVPGQGIREPESAGH